MQNLASTSLSDPDNSVDTFGQQSELLDIQFYWRLFRGAVRKYYWAMLAIAIVSAVLANMYIQSLTPVYSATTVLHVKPRNNNGIDLNQIFFEFNDPAFQETQIAILNSREILSKVVEELGLVNPPNSETSSATPESRPVSALTEFKSWLKELLGAPAVDTAQRTPPTWEELVQRRAAGLKGQLDIRPVGDSYLLNIRVTDTNPQRATDIANTLAEVYIRSIYDRDLESSLKSQSTLTERLDTQQQELRQAERTLQAYREQEDILGSEQGNVIAQGELTSIATAQRAARETRLGLENQYRQIQQLQGANFDDYLNIPAIASHSLVQSIRRELFDLDRRKSELSKRYGPKHNNMISVESDLASARQALRTQVQAAVETIRNDYRIAEQNERSLSGELASARRGQQSSGVKETRLRELEADVESKREIYNLVLTMFNQSNAISNLDNSNIRITDRAITPRAPTRGTQKFLVYVAFVLGLGMSLALGMLAEALDANINTPNDVEEKLALETLGTLPDIAGGSKKSDKDNVTYKHYHQNHHSNFSEAIRTIRTSLILSSLDRPLKRMLVTSSVPGEGKTSVAFNLAAAFGETERVLLIDTDLRRPSIDRSLGYRAHEHPGLTDLISGTKKADECITRDEKNRIDVLTSGSFSRRPLDIIGSNTFGKMLDSLDKHYDRIILDSAPCVPVSDAMMLSRQVDALLFVVKAGKTAIPQARRSLQKLARVRAPIIGVVLNRIDESAPYYEYEYYGHDYAPTEET